MIYGEMKRLTDGDETLNLLNSGIYRDKTSCVSMAYDYQA